VGPQAIYLPKQSDFLEKTMKTHMAITAALASVVLLGSSGSSSAQKAAGPSAQNYQNSSGSADAAKPEAADAPAPLAPVLRVTSVEVLRSTHGPTLDIVRVRGLASTGGWEEAELVPLTRGTPPDGILELVFVARAPAEASNATGFEVVEAIFPIESNHPFKGVNVRSATESVRVKEFPGYAEGKAAGEDCAKCVGKVFVAKGASAAASRNAGEVVREEQLPAGARVLKPGDGIASADSNPNRLTVVVGEDGRITSAVWD
jgi:hypothetical protein